VPENFSSNCAGKNSDENKWRKPKIMQTAEISFGQRQFAI
jgi:hypothetical protein